jgi:hypothetical protein
LGILPDASTDLAHRVRNPSTEQHKQDEPNNQDVPHAKTEHAGLQAAIHYCLAIGALKQVWADWVATQTVDHFQETLSAATEDGKYKILAQLLSSELYKIRPKRGC